MQPDCQIKAEMEPCTNISKWIESNAMRGHYTFTKADVTEAFPEMTQNSIRIAISRQVAKKAIVSPWHNFYVIVPTEYKLKGVVPPSFYIDGLMQFLGCRYYVALLNAAEMYGAAHQRPQNFSVFVEGKNMRSGMKASTEMLLYRRKLLPMDFVRKFQTPTGYVNVSSPELTALDLVDSEQEVGGLTRVATVLAELVEEMHFQSTNAELLRCFPAPVVQRLGYLLECVLEEQTKADGLYELTQSESLRFRKVPLKASKDTQADDEVNKKWKVIVNQEIEIDEL